MRRFSSLLIDQGAIDELAARRAERAQKQSGERYDFVLSRLGSSLKRNLRGMSRSFSICRSPAADSFPQVPLFARPGRFRVSESQRAASGFCRTRWRHSCNRRPSGERRCRSLFLSRSASLYPYNSQQAKTSRGRSAGCTRNQQ